MAVITNLIGYWPLGEASGDALDAHGSNNLTETSGTIDAASGLVGGARDFELGDTEYFMHADNAALSTGDIDYSLQFWVKLESLPGGALYALGSKGWGSADANSEWIVTVEEFGGDAYFTIRINNSAAAAQINAGTVSVGSWYAVHAYHDSVNNEIGIAINAGTATTTPYSGGATDGNGDFNIGASPLQPLYFDGLIDEVGFWKKVLTPTERTWLYNGGAGQSYAAIVAEAGGGTVTTPAFRRRRR